MEKSWNSNKIPLWFDLFFIFYMISFNHFYNLEALKYIAIVFVQIISFIKIKNEKIIFSKKTFSIIILLNASMIISLLGSQYIKYSLIKTISIIDMIITTTLVFPTALKNCSRQQLIHRVRNDILFVILFSFIIYHNDYITGTNVARQGKAMRYLFGFVHPNTTAIFSYCGLILTHFLIFNSEKKEKKYNFFIMLFFLYVIYLTDSRTAMICTLFYFLINFYFLIQKALKKNKFMLTILVGMIAFFAVIFNLDFFSYDHLNYLLSNRLYYYSQAINVLTINNKLFQGMGAYTNSATWLTNNVMIDNGYLNYLYQFGLISFIVLVIFLINNFVLIKRYVTNVKMKKFLISFYICFLIYSFFENILINISSFFAILIYFLIYCFKEEELDENISNNSSI